MAQMLADQLRAAGLRVTTQRLLLHEALQDLDRHVTADEVMQAAATKLPGLSLPTVYATLETFAGLGLVRRVDAGGPVRWDPSAEPHAHLACTVCGVLEDLPESPDSDALEAAAGRTGFTVETVDTVLHGRCAACAPG